MIKEGVVLIDKPKGWTSFDVVNKIRSDLYRSQKKELARLSHEDRLQGKGEQRTEAYSEYDKGVAEHLTKQSASRGSRMPGSTGHQRNSVRKIRVGHAGTLDPLATGLLIVLVGKEFTKKASEYSKMDKTYEVTMKLGQTSVTGDEEGEKTDISNKKPSIDEIEEALEKFEGEIMQIPHKFSAVKVNGQRAYKLARKGQEIALEPRRVTINSIDMTNYTYPLVKFTANVSSGTYIRSLAEDIGKELKTGAYMSDLRRTKIGEFDIASAEELENG